MVSLNTCGGSAACLRRRACPARRPSLSPASTGTRPGARADGQRVYGLPTAFVHFRGPSRRGDFDETSSSARPMPGRTASVKPSKAGKTNRRNPVGRAGRKRPAHRVRPANITNSLFIPVIAENRPRHRPRSRPQPMRLALPPRGAESIPRRRPTHLAGGSGKPVKAGTPPTSAARYPPITRCPRAWSKSRSCRPPCFCLARNPTHGR